MPETPDLRIKRGQAYSGLRRDVYNDERSGVGIQSATLQRCEIPAHRQKHLPHTGSGTLERLLLHSHAGAWER